MAANIKLVATTDPNDETVSFSLAFAAPSPENDEHCADAALDFGDGEALASISLPESFADDLQVFHAGTSASQTGEGVVTSGGRVLGISALGQSHEEARQRAYAASEKISFQGAQKRSDIGR